MTRPSATNAWFPYRQPRSQARLRLFCLPYAGGGASIFRQWPQLLPPEIEIWPIQLPGRENRLTEPSLTRMSLLIDTLAPVLAPYLDVPYAFFGHSMGAHISFELARMLRRHYASSPLHLLVSGRRAPQLPATYPPTHNLPDPEFIEELRRLEGTPEEVLRHEELLQLLLPTLRGDFALCETYNYVPEEPLTCPISAFGGLQDHEVTREQIIAWRQQTSGSFQPHFFAGNHFFLHTAKADFFSTLVRDLFSSI